MQAMFDAERLKDPGYYQENRERAHSDHQAYPSAQTYAAGENPLRMPLNGLWKFHYARNQGQVAPGFQNEDYDCSGWADIPVPAHIQLEGYGAPQYTNVQYPWDGVEAVAPGKEIPRRFNPVGSYIKDFFLPPEMEGKRVFVSFQGAESCLAVWLNGQYVGFASDSFDPSEFELTPYLKAERNRLACQVYRYCAGSWMEDQDFMGFSGLFREVYLYAKPQVHLRDLWVRALVDESLRKGLLDVELEVEGPGDSRAELTLGYQGEAKGTWVLEGAGRLKAQIPVESPALWSSDTPNLYTLDVVLSHAGGEPREFTRQQVGFRRIEIKDSILRINGRRLVFKGVNRQDYCGETGRAVPLDKLRRDLLAMKRCNINALRTSHYPNQDALYALCDQLGLYVIDENNMESHGTWDGIERGRREAEQALPGDREEWQGMLLDRVESMFHRHKNHPCVVMWSCGNESYGGQVIQAMSRRLRELDPTRPVHYEGVFHDRRYGDTSDVESQMYTPLQQVRDYLAVHRDKPFILCEYAHAMGNSCGAMHEYTQYAYQEPLFQGGFLWDYIDQSLRVKNRYGAVRYAYGGDMDDRPTDYNFCGDGIAYGDGTPSPKMQEVKYNYQDIQAQVEPRKATVFNRSLFLNTGVYECVAILCRNGEEMDRSPIQVSIPPLGQGQVDLPFPAQTRAGEYCVTLSFRLKEDKPWAPRGYEVAFAQGVYRVAPAQRARIVPTPPLEVIRGDYNLGVRGEHFSALFSYQGGGMTSYRYGGVEMLKGIPMPNFWRAPTDNDRGSAMPARYGQWKLASLYAKAAPERPEVTEEAGGVKVRFCYLLPTAPAAQCFLTYRVCPQGRVEVTLAYEPAQGLGDMPEFGVMLRLDADYDRVRYYGLGPEENYADRCQGARLGIFAYKAGENVSGYLRPQECGGRTGVRWAEVMDYRGRGLRFAGDSMTFSALPYTPHQLEEALHQDELPPIHYTIIRAALAQMGVGGDDSWGARTHPEYLLPADKPLGFTFSFQGI